MPPLPAAGTTSKRSPSTSTASGDDARQGVRRRGRTVELNIVVGDAQAGQAYFAAKCATCHSPTGDLQGIGDQLSDPTQLQNSLGRRRPGRPRRTWGRRPDDRRQVTVTVTPPNGQKVEGRLDRDRRLHRRADDRRRHAALVPRIGDVPKVEIRDPLEAHRNLLTVYTDKDIHDVTAYLVTLK